MKAPGTGRAARRLANNRYTKPDDTMNNHTIVERTIPAATAPEYLYIPADAIRAGDTLPDVSRFPVATVVTFPNEGVRVTFRGTSFTRHFPHGGPEFGFPSVRVERPATFDDVPAPNFVVLERGLRGAERAEHTARRAYLEARDGDDERLTATRHAEWLLAKANTISACKRLTAAMRIGGE